MVENIYMTTYEDRKMAEACDLLFGSEFRIDRETFDYLQISGIKTAFREKAKSCHPDTSIDNDSTELSNEFIQVKEAYDYLLNLKKGVKRDNASINNNDRYYTGRLPKRKLRFAEYLYYTGVVSWQMLINALVWSKRSDRRIGQFFIENGILRPDELALALIKMNRKNNITR